MNSWYLLISFLIGCLVCLPLFKYVFQAAFNNAPEFDAGHKKEEGRSAANEFINGSGETVNSFVFANIVMLLLPLIPTSFVALPIYFLLVWLL
jgi:hypothetical protein